MRGSSGSRIVVLTLCGFLVVLLLLCINQFVLQGLIMPIRVIGGSMAERFYGPHYAVCCNDCRFENRVSFSRRVNTYRVADAHKKNEISHNAKLDMSCILHIYTCAIS